MSRIVVDSDRATIAPDGWTLLQQTRAQFGVEAVVGVGLDHVVFSGTIDVEPVSRAATRSTTRNPFHHEQPVGRRRPVEPGRPATPLPGWGGRQPVAYVGPAPARAKKLSHAADPVVAILDTGCGDAPVARRRSSKKGVKLDGKSIGYDDPLTEPETDR